MNAFVIVSVFVKKNIAHRGCGLTSTIHEHESHKR